VTVRVYVPCTLHRLRQVLLAGGIGPAPVAGHAVTDAVRRELADAGEEEWEYAASSAAAQASVALLLADEPARRVVVAVDVPVAGEAAGEDPTLVQLDEVVPFRRVAAVLADSAEAEATVAAARDALGRGSADAERLLERCLDHELGWWAAQELGQLLERPGWTWG
jgi:hypothetical protein